MILQQSYILRVKWLFFYIMQAVGEARTGIHHSPAGTVAISSVAAGFSSPLLYVHLRCYIRAWVFVLSSLFPLSFPNLLQSPCCPCPAVKWPTFECSLLHSVSYFIFRRPAVTSVDLLCHITRHCVKHGQQDFGEKMISAVCEQLLGNQGMMVWFYYRTLLIKVAERRTEQRLLNLILLPERMTYSQCVRNAIFQMTSSPVTVWLWLPAKCWKFSMFSVWEACLSLWWISPLFFKLPVVGG